jgi:hypothetical protein
MLLACAAYAHSPMNRFWGEVPVDMTLAGDVLIVKPLIVPEDVKLTIEAGTVVRFEKSRDAGNGIIVKGELVAVGSAGKAIRFVPKDASSGKWRGIEFAATGRGRLEDCVLEKSNYGVAGQLGKVTRKDITIK